MWRLRCSHPSRAGGASALPPLLCSQPCFLPDVDECAAETPPCSDAQYCENVNGSYTCEGDQSVGTCGLHRFLSSSHMCDSMATCVVDMMQTASASPRVTCSVHPSSLGAGRRLPPPLLQSVTAVSLGGKTLHAHRISLCSPGAHCVDPAGLKLSESLLPLLPECWG